MRVASLKYERKFNLGNYETETIAIEIVLEEGERASNALASAQSFVEAGRRFATPPPVAS